MYSFVSIVYFIFSYQEKLYYSTLAYILTGWLRWIYVCTLCMPAVVVILARFYGIGRLQQLLGNGIGGQQQLVDESHHAIELPTFSTDNIGLPRESLTTRREGTETMNDESPRPREQLNPVSQSRRWPKQRGTSWRKQHLHLPRWQAPIDLHTS